MASGAPKPGGYSAIPPGGHRVTPAGGTDLNDRATRLRYDGFPTLDVTPEAASGPRSAVSRTATVRLGRSSGVSYAWTLPTVPGGSTTAVGSITGGTSATAGFTPDVAGTYTFRCTATFTEPGQANTVLVKNVTYTSA